MASKLSAKKLQGNTKEMAKLEQEAFRIWGKKEGAKKISKFREEAGLGSYSSSQLAAKQKVIRKAGNIDKNLTKARADQRDLEGKLTTNITATEKRDIKSKIKALKKEEKRLEKSLKLVEKNLKKKGFIRRNWDKAGEHLGYPIGKLLPNTYDVNIPFNKVLNSKIKNDYPAWADASFRIPKDDNVLNLFLKNELNFDPKKIGNLSFKQKQNIYRYYRFKRGEKKAQGGTMYYNSVALVPKAQNSIRIASFDDVADQDNSYMDNGQVYDNSVPRPTINTSSVPVIDPINIEDIKGRSDKYDYCDASGNAVTTGVTEYVKDKTTGKIYKITNPDGSVVKSPTDPVGGVLKNTGSGSAPEDHTGDKPVARPVVTPIVTKPTIPLKDPSIVPLNINALYRDRPATPRLVKRNKLFNWVSSIAKHLRPSDFMHGKIIENAVATNRLQTPYLSQRALRNMPGIEQAISSSSKIHSADTADSFASMQYKLAQYNAGEKRKADAIGKNAEYVWKQMESNHNIADRNSVNAIDTLNRQGAIDYAAYSKFNDARIKAETIKYNADRKKEENIADAPFKVFADEEAFRLKQKNANINMDFYAAVRAYHNEFLPRKIYETDPAKLQQIDYEFTRQYGITPQQANEYGSA